MSLLAAICKPPISRPTGCGLALEDSLAHDVAVTLYCLPLRGSAAWCIHRKQQQVRLGFQFCTTLAHIRVTNILINIQAHAARASHKHHGTVTVTHRFKQAHKVAQSHKRTCRHWHTGTMTLSQNTHRHTLGSTHRLKQPHAHSHDVKTHRHACPHTIREKTYRAYAQH